ncbi:LCP family protein [Virgibacillus doumboii]|uniref:LCP family protein n=1 Tax=Virgibacillus doumboii TaxID=2697503 RepID=UPI0013DEAF01|nr:LCP family protein [Virgibacillus doumboii]
MDKKKFDKESLSYLEDEELEFTTEDRQQTFARIQEKNHAGQKKNIFHFFRFKLGPVTAAVFAFVLAVGVLMPVVFSGDKTNEMTSEIRHATIQNYNSFSLLLLGKEPSNRTSFNILMTYNGDTESMKILTIPRDTYAPIIDDDEKTLYKDKLTHAFAIGAGPEATVASVSKLFDIPVNYYAVVPAKELADELDISRGIMRKGLLGSKVQESLTIDKMKDIVEQGETNISTDNFHKLISGVNVTEFIDLKSGLEVKTIDGIYYLEIGEKKLNSVSTNLNQHLQGE